MLMVCNKISRVGVGLADDNSNECLMLGYDYLCSMMLSVGKVKVKGKGAGGGSVLKFVGR